MGWGEAVKLLEQCVNNTELYARSTKESKILLQAQEEVSIAKNWLNIEEFELNSSLVWRFGKRLNQEGHCSVLMQAFGQENLTFKIELAKTKKYYEVTDGKLSVCNHCKISFDSFQLFTDHVFEKHYLAQNCRWQCNVCNSKSFPYFEAFQSHVYHNHRVETTVTVQFQWVDLQKTGTYLEKATFYEQYECETTLQMLIKLGESVLSNFGSYWVFFWNCQDFATWYLYTLGIPLSLLGPTHSDRLTGSGSAGFLVQRAKAIAWFKTVSNCEEQLLKPLTYTPVLCCQCPYLPPMRLEHLHLHLKLAHPLIHNRVAENPEESENLERTLHLLDYIEDKKQDSDTWSTRLKEIAELFSWKICPARGLGESQSSFYIQKILQELNESFNDKLFSSRLMDFEVYTFTGSSVASHHSVLLHPVGNALCFTLEIRKTDICGYFHPFTQVSDFTSFKKTKLKFAGLAKTKTLQSLVTLFIDLLLNGQKEKDECIGFCIRFVHLIYPEKPRADRSTLHLLGSISSVYKLRLLAKRYEQVWFSFLFFLSNHFLSYFWFYSLYIFIIPYIMGRTVEFLFWGYKFIIYLWKAGKHSSSYHIICWCYPAVQEGLLYYKLLLCPNDPSFIIMLYALIIWRQSYHRKEGLVSLFIMQAKTGVQEPVQMATDWMAVLRIRKCSIYLLLHLALLLVELCISCFLQQRVSAWDMIFFLLAYSMKTHYLYLSKEVNLEISYIGLEKEFFDKKSITAVSRPKCALWSSVQLLVRGKSLLKSPDSDAILYSQILAKLFFKITMVSSACFVIFMVLIFGSQIPSYCFITVILYVEAIEKFYMHHEFRLQWTSCLTSQNSLNFSVSLPYSLLKKPHDSTSLVEIYSLFQNKHED
ncbi:uncharacterized protein LOC106466260 [Limulus polyphemus]|uniref:Uncharacterized protein LOC106466260 n=1 Tax=Limulus polyphemus TaxID=6850 RepID=A0ABM1BH98_LIMPO|nr:uncharacterized protein LOC106466260 [Limulus polyphemus]